jgi:gliding motility-associated-like protein
LGDTIRFNNLPFFATGNYQIKTSRTNGCDSVINLQLTVNSPQFLSQQLSLCNTYSFAYRNKKYPLPLSLRDTLSAFTGCDSVFELSVISHNIKSDFSIDSSQFPTLKFIGKTTNAKQWIWDLGDLNGSNIQSPTHSYVKSFLWISYKVCLVVRDSFGCDDTLCLDLPIKPEVEIQIPEGISPNGDGVNDTLVIPGLWAFPKASWVIFNRWGQVVFESNAQQNIAWDGRNHASGQNQNNTSAELLPEGVYFIVFNYNDGHRPNLTKNIYLKR